VAAVGRAADDDGSVARDRDRITVVEQVLERGCGMGGRSEQRGGDGEDCDGWPHVVPPPWSAVTAVGGCAVAGTQRPVRASGARGPRRSGDTPAAPAPRSASGRWTSRGPTTT